MKESYHSNLNGFLDERTVEIIHYLNRALPNDKRRKLNRSKFFELLREELISYYKTRLIPIGRLSGSFPSEEMDRDKFNLPVFTFYLI